MQMVAKSRRRNGGPSNHLAIHISGRTTAETSGILFATRKWERKNDPERNANNMQCSRSGRGNLGTRLGNFGPGTETSRTKIPGAGPARGLPRQHCVRRNSGRLECTKSEEL